MDHEKQSKDELLDIEEDQVEELLTKWGISDSDGIKNRIHIPCGKRIYNIQEAIREGEIKMDKLTNAIPVLH